MKQIGKFAKENKVTVKTLHHYEKLGLIAPKYVDAETGYRYYSDVESNDLKVILFLKDLGLSLSEIKDLFDGQFDKEKFIEFMQFKKQQATNDLHSTSNRLYKLDKLIDLIEGRESKEIKMKELIGMSEKQLFTGVYGRGKFIEEAELKFNRAKKNNTPLCVMELDLDHFKRVNDNYGYEVGDIVIQRTQDEIVSVLQKLSVPSLLERRGGDEFTIVLEEKPMKAAIIASTICDSVVSIDYSDVAEDLSVSITAGIAGISEKTEVYYELVHDATNALYQNKKNSRK